MTHGSLMKVKSVAECSPWSILGVQQYIKKYIGINCDMENQYCNTYCDTPGIFIFVNYCPYSPATIIRNAKIWNIILSLAFFRTLGSNLDLEYPAVSEENCLKNILPLP